MKKLFIIIVIGLSMQAACGQSHEMKQLMLNLEKLAQFKKILNQLYDGYKVLDKGYTEIKNIAEGNFGLHQKFLDALLAVSPSVARYKRIGETMRMQVALVRDYRAALSAFRTSQVFTLDELDYLAGVYDRLLSESLSQLDDLLMVITAGKLRMNDNERLVAIDRVYGAISKQYIFLQTFNKGTQLLVIQRQKESKEIQLSKKLNRLP